MKRASLFTVLAAAILIAACSDNPPQINNIQWQVILFQNRLIGVTYQKLSVFVAGSDKDGPKDLEALHVIQDDEELYWTLPAEKWERATIHGSEWIGSNGLTMPDNRPLPAGMYRVVLEDKSGKTVESQMYVKKENVDTKDAVFPAVSLKDGRITVTGDFTDPEVWVYNANDQFLDRFPLPPKTIDVATITAKYKQLASGFTYYVYAKKNGVYYGVMSGPYYYSP
jgi:hypothetical protein